MERVSLSLSRPVPFPVKGCWGLRILAASAAARPRWRSRPCVSRVPPVEAAYPRYTLGRWRRFAEELLVAGPGDDLFPPHGDVMLKVCIEREAKLSLHDSAVVTSEVERVGSYLWRRVVTTYNQSRDHGEQRLGSYLDTRSDPNIYVRYRARRRHRDPDSSAPRFHWQPRCPDDGYTHPSDCLPLFVRYLPLLPHL